MEVKLSPELEQKVRQRAGEHFASPSDVVAEALKSFFGPDSMTAAEIDDLNRSIDNGLADVRSGHWIEGDEAREVALHRLKSRHKA
jgi:predicted transcriptional regulator